MGLPTIYETQPSMEITRQIVERLVPPEAEPLGTAEIEGAFTASRGNVRETLMRLYDVYQRA
jgi:DNA-binding GntR family transcriptional regulator